MTNKMIFVFGSNEQGEHMGGAARDAYQRHGALWGRSYGHYGDSFAIPTLDVNYRNIPIPRLTDYVNGFLTYALSRLDYQFKVTQIGCGIAGFTKEQIAPLFKWAPGNCQFDTEWQPILGDDYDYWGTFGQ
jgi:hypothetical protein